MVDQGHQLVHAISEPVLGPEIVKQRHDLRDHEEGVAVRGIVPSRSSAARMLGKTVSAVRAKTRSKGVGRDMGGR